MKKYLIIALVALLPSLIFAQTAKDQEKFNYVSNQLKLSKEVKAKLQPIYYAYLRDLHAAKAAYNDMKTKLETSIKKKVITADQAKALLNAHWACDAKTAEVKKAYTTKFYTVLTPQQVYHLFAYSNDSKSKRAGK